MTTQSIQSQITTPNLQVEAAEGATYRYRRFGTPNESNLPLVCLVHFRATLDNWDPELVDTIATEREVILVDLAGVGGSTGTAPPPTPSRRWPTTPSPSSTPSSCTATTCSASPSAASSPRR
jgi:pimeloyl-ACP methyl ester carboxylesterase